MTINDLSDLYGDEIYNFYQNSLRKQYVNRNDVNFIMTFYTTIMKSFHKLSDEDKEILLEKSIFFKQVYSDSDIYCNIYYALQNKQYIEIKTCIAYIMTGLYNLRNNILIML